MGTGGEGGRQSTQGPPSYRVWGEGEARATVLVLHTFEMHADLSFSHLRFAEAASFDKKELRRSCTEIKCITIYYIFMKALSTCDTTAYSEMDKSWTQK